MNKAEEKLLELLEEIKKKSHTWSKKMKVILIY